MPRRRVTLRDLVAGGRFDPANSRHLRALDESGPLDDPGLEELRRRVLRSRRMSDRRESAFWLRELERQVAEAAVLRTR
jgi:hypothetical protein